MPVKYESRQNNEKLTWSKQTLESQQLMPWQAKFIRYPEEDDDNNNNIFTFNGDNMLILFNCQ